MTRHNEVALEHSLITTVNNSEKWAPRTTDRRLEIGVIFLLSCALWSLNAVWLSRDTEPPAWDMAVHQTYALNYLSAADLPSDTRFWERSGNYPPFVHIVIATRSEEHTSELQSPYDLVCRLLLEKKKKK